MSWVEGQSCGIVKTHKWEIITTAEFSPRSEGSEPPCWAPHLGVLCQGACAPQDIWL